MAPFSLRVASAALACRRVSRPGFTCASRGAGVSAWSFNPREGSALFLQSGPTNAQVAQTRAPGAFRSPRRLLSTAVYHEGLLHTEFSSRLEISRDSPVIPIFRILNPEGGLAEGWTPPFSKEETLELYKFMVRLSVWDNMLYNIQRQGRISFYIQNQGEEATQTGVGKALQPSDHLFCQYRELGVLLQHGFSLDDALGQLFSTLKDDSKGRQMPISYSKKSVNLHTICTPLTTQVPHCSGAGYAFRLGREDRVAVGFFGEGAASEGDFHAALNFAATLKGNTLFVCRNNGYAISTPVKDQYAGDGIAIRGVAYGMRTVRVDGNDLFAVFTATKAAREAVLTHREPVLMEFMTYRAGHHSTSDDSFAYRPEGEMEAWQASGAMPIARLRRFLELQGVWGEAEDEALRKEARGVLLEKIKAGEKTRKWPVANGIFDDVYSHPVAEIEEQRQEFLQHVETHRSSYDLTPFQGIQQA